MSLAELIRERRSIRRFNELPVAEKLVVELLEKATQLYCSDTAVRWRYVFAGNPEARVRLAEYMLGKMKESKLGRLVPNKMMDVFKKRLEQVPANLIVIAETDPDRRIANENFAAVCSILQIFQLLGWERKLGMLWDTEPLIQNELFFKRIGVRDGERFVGILHLGYFDKIPKGRARTPAEKKWTVFDGKLI